jgi:hypothetical protein
MDIIKFSKILSTWVDICILSHSPWLFQCPQQKTQTLIDHTKILFEGEWENSEIDIIINRIKTISIEKKNTLENNIININKFNYDIWSDIFDLKWESITMHINKINKNNIRVHFTDKNNNISMKSLLFNEECDYDFHKENVIPWLYCQS